MFAGKHCQCCAMVGKSKSGFRFKSGFNINTEMHSVLGSPVCAFLLNRFTYQVWNKVGPLPVKRICLCVCKNMLQV